MKKYKLTVSYISLFGAWGGCRVAPMGSPCINYNRIHVSEKQTRGSKRRHDRTQEGPGYLSVGSPVSARSVGSHQSAGSPQAPGSPQAAGSPRPRFRPRARLPP